jgi:hypothetical protein
MESLARLVSESLVRHGLDRPVDYRRLRWSRWFRCESHHSLLVVPSKPGVFALAEEIVSLNSQADHGGTTDLSCPAERSEACVEERLFGAPSCQQRDAAIAAMADRSGEAESQKAETARRMLAVTQFFEDEDMAFVLDRMLTKPNPVRERLSSGRYFVRFVVIEDRFHRRSIHNALTQWLSDSAGKAGGIGSHFAASLELTPGTEYVPFETHVARTPPSATSGTNHAQRPGGEESGNPVLSDDSGATANLHCPLPFPAGF